MESNFEAASDCIEDSPLECDNFENGKQITHSVMVKRDTEAACAFDCTPIAENCVTQLFHGDKAEIPLKDSVSLSDCAGAQGENVAGDVMVEECDVLVRDGDEEKTRCMLSYIDATDSMVMHALLHIHFLKLLNFLESSRKSKTRTVGDEKTQSCPEIYIRTKSIGVQTHTLSCTNTRQYGRLAKCVKQLLRNRTFTQDHGCKMAHAGSFPVFDKQTTQWHPYSAHCFPTKTSKIVNHMVYPGMYQGYYGCYGNWYSVRLDHGLPNDTVGLRTLPNRSISCGSCIDSNRSIFPSIRMEHEGVCMSYKLRYTAKAQTCPKPGGADAHISRTFEKQLKKTKKKLKKKRIKSSPESSRSSKASKDKSVSHSGSTVSSRRSDGSGSSSSSSGSADSSSSTSSDEDGSTASTSAASSTADTSSDSSSETCNSDETELDYTWEELMKVPGCEPVDGFVVYGHVLGEGVYGKVYSATLVKGQEMNPVAVKIFKSNNKVKELKTLIFAQAVI